MTPEVFITPVTCGSAPVPLLAHGAYRRVVTPSGRSRRRGPVAGGAVRPDNSGPASTPAKPAPTPASTLDRRPVALVAICALVLLEVGLLVGLAGAWARELVQGVAQLPGATAFLILFALGVATVLVLAIRGLWRGRRWARSPVMTWQVLLVALALTGFGDDPSPWVVAMLVLGLLVGVGLLLPPVVAATVGRPGPR